MEVKTDADVDQNLKKLVDRIQGLPTLPVMLSTINKMMMNPKTSAKEVSQVISSDPSITSKVLRVVNSSFYGFPNRITTVTHAIVILGFNTIKSIVLSSSIFDVFKKGASSGFDRQEFWKHSIGCGAISRMIARRLGFPAPEEVFIAGLLHDIGKIVMDQYAHDRFMEVLQQTRARDCLLVQAESDLLGVTHAEVGAWLFDKWNLSKGLVETTRCHHNPALATENSRTAAIVHVSDIFARAIRFGNGGDNKVPALRESAWKQLNFEPNQFDTLLKDSGEEIEKAMIFLDFIK
jgi:putative nucleotidyltransferase with HDIG domain